MITLPAPLGTPLWNLTRNTYTLGNQTTYGTQMFNALNPLAAGHYEYLGLENYPILYEKRRSLSFASDERRPLAFFGNSIEYTGNRSPRVFNQDNLIGDYPVRIRQITVKGMATSPEFILRIIKG